MEHEKLPEGGDTPSPSTSGRKRKLIYLDFPGSLASVEVDEDDDTPVSLWYVVPPLLVVLVLILLYVAQVER